MKVHSAVIVLIQHPERIWGMAPVLFWMVLGGSIFTIAACLYGMKQTDYTGLLFVVALVVPIVLIGTAVTISRREPHCTELFVLPRSFWGKAKGIGTQRSRYLLSGSVQ